MGFALSLFFIGLPFALDFSQDIFSLYLLAGFVVLGIVILDPVGQEQGKSISMAGKSKPS